MKAKIFILALVAAITTVTSAQNVPPLFFGENAWMPDSVGNKRYYGKLESNWANVASSKVQLIRYGGIDPDTLLSSNTQYLKIVDSVRAKGMEPALQVPYYGGIHDSGDARRIVEYVNITKARKVKYWIIGNEPDNTYPANERTAKAIAKYIREYAIAMKKVDSSIKIIGPEFSRIKPENPSDPNTVVMDSLTGTGAGYANTSIIGRISGNGNASGKAYIDYLSWHVYPWDGSGTAQARHTVRNRIKDVDSARVGRMKRKCNAINADPDADRASYPLKPVITEANICYYSGGSTPSGDNIDGVKANSFLAGQFWMEYMALAMDRGLEWINFWSVIEGLPTGYLYNSSSNPVKKPTYYHMQQFAKYYTDLGTGTSTHYIGSTNDTLLKAFAVKTTEKIAVFIMNQTQPSTAYKPYTLRLDNTSFTATYKVWFPTMGLSKQYTDSIYGESTTMLLFDCGGNISAKYRYERKDTANPWKSVWAASSPSAIYSVSAGADYTLCCPGCTHTFNATASPSGGTHTYAWYKNGTYVGSGSSYTASGAAGSVNTIKVVMTTGSCTTSDEAILTVGNGPNCSGPSPRAENPVVHNPSAARHDDATPVFSLVPNPAMNAVSVHYSLQQAEAAEMRVYDVQGLLVAKYPLSAKHDSIEIDCTNWPSGVYSAVMASGGLVLKTEKLVITK